MHSVISNVVLRIFMICNIFAYLHLSHDIEDMQDCFCIERGFVFFYNHCF